MDFTGMKPSDALEKAHEAFPETEWDYLVCCSNTACCSVGLLGRAILGDCTELNRYQAVNEMFYFLPGATLSHKWEYPNASSISFATRYAESFPEAIKLLRALGW